ncbi:hypothetical protein [Sphingomonas elodea]|uniref:hypothetical protein n=1 Tax=Sphingomonas elodea TaxID=179878 RepID=UPI00026316C8|nr:hypothetical protein [Sphingomonas elodea]
MKTFPPSQAPRVLQWRWIAVLALVSALPFLFVPVPPLVDVPGHIGRFAVQMAPADSVLHRYFSFDWRPTLNLGSDLVVQALHPVLGPIAAMWLVCAAVPVLTMLGLLGVARRLNPRGAAALPWALILVYNDSFLWGFVNYALSAALALCGFALWMGWDARPRLRAACFALLTPALFLAHGEGGALLALWIAAFEAERLGPWRLKTLAARLWPLGVAAVPVLLARGGEQGGVTLWNWPSKADALFNLVRDQNLVFDVAAALAMVAVLIVGRMCGARIARPGAWAVWGSFALFLVAPFQLSGTANVDARLLAHAMMLALVLQDWHGTGPRLRRGVAVAGAALLVLRFAVTTASFIGYGRDYARQLAALDHIAPGSRVLNLTLSDCGARGWRQPRTTHLAALATAERDAWVNVHWAVKAVHLLQVRYAPAGFATDPSQIVYAPGCTGTTGTGNPRLGIAQVLPRLPLDQVDYLWLIDVTLPPGPRDPRLVPVWQSNDSALYAIHHIKAT